MIDKIKNTLLIMLLCTLFIYTPVLADSNDPIPPDQMSLQLNYTDIWVAANSGLNIRLLPSTDAIVLKTISYGTKIKRITSNYIQGWDLVKYKNTIGYVYNKYVTEEQIDASYLGSYRITFYCTCERCNGHWAGQPTASGAWYEEGVTIATGKEFSFGTKLLIQGHVYTVQDRGVPNGCIDIYLDSHSQCYRRGLYYTDIYLIE